MKATTQRYTPDLEGLLQALRALTIMGTTPGGCPIIGPAGWENLQELIAQIERAHLADPARP